MKPGQLQWVVTFLMLLLFHASATVLYVDLNSTNPTPPYADWSTAATNIQDAVGASTNGDLILVTNGVYATGGRVIYGSLTNRVAIDKAVTVQSINGPAATVIQGYQIPGTTNGDSAVRCVYLTNNTELIGFTLTSGATRKAGYANQENSGGGVWCESTSAFLSNCVLTANAAFSLSGGAYSGTLNNCTLAGNMARGDGGGAKFATLNNCLINGNSGNEGGGASICRLDNCTIVTNKANFGGGADGCTLENCIVYYNAGNAFNYRGSFMTNCCTFPMPPGTGNIINPPIFVNLAGGDFHLQFNSPCINSGNNAYVTGTTDLDGNPRIIGGTVDIGAYEYQTPTSIISYAWLQQYGLPTDGSVDYADLDGTGMNNWQKWIAGLNPTNPASVLAMLPPVATNNTTGVTVGWQSVNTRTYYLQISTNLGAQPAFSTIQSNIVGQAGTTSYTDSTATNGGPYFYRVGVQ